MIKSVIQGTEFAIQNQNLVTTKEAKEPRTNKEENKMAAKEFPKLLRMINRNILYNMLV